MTYYPGAGEGSVVEGSVIAQGDAAPVALHRRGVARVDQNSSVVVVDAVGRELTGETSEDRARRRARAAIRRYATANNVRRLLTLTYRPPQPTDPADVLPHVAAFLKRLRADRPEIAYVRVLERHESGALHVHIGLGADGARLSQAKLSWMWGRGIVDIRLIRSRRGGHAAARAAAGYLAKYVVKEAVRVEGGHRYEVRQGRQPAIVRAVAWSMAEGLRALIGLAGGEVPSYEWFSGSETDWRGPPVAFAAFG